MKAKANTQTDTDTATAADSAPASPLDTVSLSGSEVLSLQAPPCIRSTDEESTSTFSVKSRENMTEKDVYGARLQIMDLQKQLLEGLNKPQPMQERDSFCDYLRSVMYRFTPAIWRRCQVEMLQVLQKYQELNDPQQQHTAYVVADPSPSSLQSYSQGNQPCSSSQMWQPPPSQWPSKVTNPTTVWNSQEATWVQQQCQQPVQQSQQCQQPVQQSQQSSQQSHRPSQQSQDGARSSCSAPALLPSTPSQFNTSGQNISGQSSFNLTSFLEMDTGSIETVPITSDN